MRGLAGSAFGYPVGVMDVFATAELALRQAGIAFVVLADATERERVDEAA